MESALSFRELDTEDLKDMMSELGAKMERNNSIFNPTFFPFFEAYYREPIHLDWSNHLIETYFKATSTRRFLKFIRDCNRREPRMYHWIPPEIPDESEVHELKIFLSLYNLKLFKPNWDVHYYVDYAN